MTTPNPSEIELIDPPLDHQEAEDNFDAPYERMSSEPWDITKKLLEARLGPYAPQRGSIYNVPPEGSRHLGFQQEYPVDFFTSQSGEPFVLNLVLKGVFLQNIYPVWMSTHMGIVGRSGKDAEMVTFEQIGLIQEPLGKLEETLFTPKGKYIGQAKANRAIKILRKANKYLYLPEWVMHERESVESEEQ